MKNLSFFLISWIIFMIRAVEPFAVLLSVGELENFKEFEDQIEWKNFKKRFGKTYVSDVEHEQRFQIFRKNWEFIKNHNEKFESGETTFSLQVNQFADMSDDEFKKMNGFKRRNVYVSPFVKFVVGHGIPFVAAENIQLPDQVDWRKKGAVTNVKNQGECGSCWAFSATGALEGQHFRVNGTLVPLSEQNLVDCSSRFGNLGCDGGTMDNAFKYVKFNHGIDTEMGYPYEAHNGRCEFDPRKVGADDAGYVDIPSRSEQKLQVAVATVGPISVAIDASSSRFRFYHQGVYYDTECSNSELDHGVLAVGYGTDPTTNKDYWLVKNSWGVTWGDGGYIKMSRNRGNNCGIATAASYPLVRKEIKY